MALRVATHTSLRPLTWSSTRRSAPARPGRPTIRRCRPNDIMRTPSPPASSNSHSKVSMA